MHSFKGSAVLVPGDDLGHPSPNVRDVLSDVRGAATCGLNYLKGSARHLRMPITEWLPTYSMTHDLRGDVNAGILVFVLLIPQGMAYADLAGYPAIYGLYCATIPLYVYALFGE